MNMIFIGHLVLEDVILPGKLYRPDQLGGAALYAASGAYLWQRDGLHLLSRRGTDFDDSFLKKAGVDISGVRVFSDIPTIHLFTMFDRMDLRYFIVQRWAGSYDAMAPRPEDFPSELITSDNCFHVAAFPLPRQQAVIEAVPDGAFLSVDPHHDYVYPEQHHIWDRLLKKITVFQPSEDELIRYFSISPLSDIGGYLPYMQRLADKGPRIIVLKLGARGVLGYDRVSQEFHFIPSCSGEVVDVTGCGDTFCGGFLASYTKNHDLRDALICGSISSSFNISHFGVCDNFLVSPSDVEARKKEYTELWKGVSL
ncbi:MAG: carbohydrate kinase family protein [Eubacteriales bacterium]|nr:carbohydrate kinase family protein [Eubacteriales bacterium]